MTTTPLDAGVAEVAELQRRAWARFDRTWLRGIKPRDRLVLYAGPPVGEEEIVTVLRAEWHAKEKLIQVTGRMGPYWVNPDMILRPAP
jgi:hypothetical protein